MNDGQPPIRVYGQRLISSSFLTRSSNPFKKLNEDAERKSSKGSHLSLSDFLDRKLPQETSVPRTVKGKSRPFSSLQGPRDSDGSINDRIGNFCEVDSETESAIAKVLFEQFKRSDLDQGESSISGSANEADISNTVDTQASRKRKTSFEGQNRGRKNVIVLGGDPKPGHKGKEAIYNKNEKPRSLYNHYASGSGWWDCNMEGVDNEEVGLGEVWEGIGSTTLGGMEWH